MREDDAGAKAEAKAKTKAKVEAEWGHPRFETLLELRDEVGGPEAASHVEACPACAAEVERLRRVRAELRSLAGDAPTRNLWPAIAGEMVARRARRVRRSLLAVAALLAVGALTVILAARLRAPLGTPAEIEAVTPARAELEGLIRTSRFLQEELGVKEGVQDGAEAWASAALEERLEIVDAHIHDVEAIRRAPEDRIPLWRERVRLLSVLVDLRGPRRRVAAI